MDETELVRRLKAKDEAALRAFIAQYRNRLVPIIWKILRDEELVEEVWGDVLTKVWGNIVQYDTGRAPGFAAWVQRITLNCAVDTWRRRKRRQVVEQTTPLDEMNYPSAATAPMEESLIETEEAQPSPRQLACRDALRQALGRLNERQRLLLLLRAEGRPPGEIAHILNMSADNAYSKSNQAAEALLRELTKDDRIQQWGIALPSRTETLAQLRQYQVGE